MLTSAKTPQQEQSIKVLTERLESGYQMISAAAAEGRDVRLWEEHWLQLLADYELAFRDSRQVA